MIVRFGLREGGLRSVHGSARTVDRSFGLEKMAFADGHAVEGAPGDFSTGGVQLGFAPKLYLKFFQLSPR